MPNSVPARFNGQNVRVLLWGNELLVFERRKVVARHPRLTRRGEFRDELDHYLEMLLAKPGAMAGSTALATARQNGSFTEVHEAFWAAARTAHGDAAGTRARGVEVSATVVTGATAAGSSRERPPHTSVTGSAGFRLPYLHDADIRGDAGTCHGASTVSACGQG
ncbi:Mu transposase domain-containing protein [Streptomyces avermitilis]|uniref:Mu transposase domain-containing protein n=1 Tax=Streptomyces avermitilis TaxID=33903 RepID=UPI0036B7352D